MLFQLISSLKVSLLVSVLFVAFFVSLLSPTAINAAIPEKKIAQKKSEVKHKKPVLRRVIPDKVLSSKKKISLKKTPRSNGNQSSKTTLTKVEPIKQPQTVIFNALPNAPVLKVDFHGEPELNSIEVLRLLKGAQSYIVEGQSKIYLTIDPDLQLKTEEMLARYRVPWGAIVAIQPRTGRVLAAASYSEREPAGGELSTRATFPAASLFKLVTASAAIEKSGLTGSDVIYYRGGNYTLNPRNYLPSLSDDRRRMTFAEALGKSVNPVFARVALNNLSSNLIERYALQFGFNSRLPFDAPLEISSFEKPTTDYDIARTAAGFGNVTISPLHAAVVMAAIANGGILMRPHLIDRIVNEKGDLIYSAKRMPVRTVVLSSTASELLAMMEETTETGTARRQFLRIRNPFLKSTTIAAKTGTLSGDNPKGVYHWFVAAVPSESPEIALCTLLIDPGGARVKSSTLAREFLEYYFRNKDSGIETSKERTMQVS